MKTKILLLMFVMTSLSLMAKKDNVLTKKEIKDGWTLLFNGRDTDGWTTPSGKQVPEGWSVAGGSITAVKGGKGGDIVTVNEYANFVLSVDFNIEPGCNSGIKYFFTKYPTGGNLGLEYQILDDVLGEDNKKDNHLLGAFYDVIAPTGPKKVNAPGKWNNIRIVAMGNNVEHWLNGVKILEFTRGSQAYTAAVAESKFRSTVPAFGMVEKGKILLQEHGGQISFKNIKIKTL